MSIVKQQDELSIIEKSLFGVSFDELPKLIPGLFVVGFITIISIKLSDYIGKDLLGFSKSPISSIMMAIVIGLFISGFVKIPAILKCGITFSIKKILRLGIILLGIRLTIFDVFKLGAFGVPIVFICIIGALIVTTWINNKLNLPERLGVLIAIGTSICGVTAIVAASPAIDAEEEESAYAIAIITIFGLIATIFYPYLAYIIFDGNAIQAGMFLGTSVHETAQVIGAGQIYADLFNAPSALNVATITKLVRNVFMAAVIPFMAYYYARKNQEGEFKGQKISFFKLFPLFIFGFITFTILRSIGDSGINAGTLSFGLFSEVEWENIIHLIKKTAETLLVMALAGVGLNTNFKSFKALGYKPFLVGLVASFSAGIISFFTILLLSNFINI